MRDLALRPRSIARVTSPPPGAAFPPLDAVRRWVTALDDPDRLVDPAMVELLRLTSRLPIGGSRVEVARAAAQLVRDTVDRLKPSRTATYRDQMAHRVLQTCFVEGVKAETAATRLAVSVRQLSRERTRAIELLHAELLALLRESGEEEAEAAAAPAHRYRFEPVPAIADFVARPAVARAVADAVRDDTVVHVHGPAGIGKTSLVAELAAGWATTAPLLWYRVRAGVNDTLRAVLFELAEYLRAADLPHLAEVTAASLPRVDVSLVSRVAISELDGHPGVLVFDDYHLSEADPAIGSFLDDITSRLPELRVVTVGRHREPRPRAATPIAVPALTPRETRAMLHKIGAADPGLVDVAHSWTGGIPQLVQLAGPWLATATAEEITGGVVTFTERDEVQAFLLDSLTGLMDSYDRDILEAASIFRDQFTDAALASVTGRTTSQVGDISRRLVRYHVALRSRGGDVAFVHTSIRDYVYQRLSPDRRRQLHARAVEWYESRGATTEAAYHEARARESLAE
jgi:ATP/maltotriose-dependent transcriptional regulator MalT